MTTRTTHEPSNEPLTTRSTSPPATRTGDDENCNPAQQREPMMMRTVNKPANQQPATSPPTRIHNNDPHQQRELRAHQQREPTTRPANEPSNDPRWQRELRRRAPLMSPATIPTGNKSCEPTSDENQRRAPLMSPATTGLPSRKQHLFTFSAY